MPEFKPKVDCTDMSRDITRYYETVDKLHRDVEGNHIHLEFDPKSEKRETHDDSDGYWI